LSRKAWYAGALCAFVSACAPSPLPTVYRPAQVWPTKGWSFSTPEAQGIDSNALANAIETIRAKRIPIHSLFMERNGYVVLDAYFFPFEDNETHNLASVTKSVISTLVGIAKAEHRIGTLEQPVLATFPGERPGDGDPRKSRITLANLLSMTSGLDCAGRPGENLLLEMEHSPDWVAFMLDRPQVSEPGAVFEYCGGNMHLVSAALTKVMDTSAYDLAREAIFEPLGITRAVWPADPNGISHGFADLELQPRDAAKLGYLWLHHGRWEGRQIVPETYLSEALTPHAKVQPGIDYGYGFWLYPSHTPFDFEANGRGGQRITVTPAENLVEVVTAGGADANAVAPLLAAAVRSDVPLPANASGDARLAEAVGAAAQPPRARNPAPPPRWAYAIAGRTWVLGDNSLGLRTLRLSITADDRVSARLGFADGTIGDHPVGMDGVPGLSVDPATGHRVALLGWWADGAFELDYDEVARIDDYRLRLVPAGAGLDIRLWERTGLVDMRLTGKPA
jgi:CubicO group peptidase (beta-lactamase class C family)